MNFQYFRGVFRRQYLLSGIIVIAGGSLTIGVVLFASRRFQSDAKLLVTLGHENVTQDPTTGSAGNPSTILRTNDNEIATALQLMQSEAILEDVIQAVGEDVILSGRPPSQGSGGSILGTLTSAMGSLMGSIDPIEDRERAIIKLGDGLRMDAKDGANVVNVHYQSKSPEVAQLVLEHWIDSFLKRYSTMYETKGSMEFLQQQEFALRERLESQTQKLRDQKTRYAMVTVSGSQQKLESQLRWAEQSYIECQSNLHAVQAKLKSLRQSRDQTPAQIVVSTEESDTNDTASGMRNQLYQLELEERRLASKMTQSHPKYSQVSSQLADAKRLMNNQTDKSQMVNQGLHPLYVTLLDNIVLAESEEASLQSRKSMTQQIISELGSRLKRMNQQESDIAALQRDIDLLEVQYRLHHERSEQARMAFELKSNAIHNVNVVQPPT
ncbi:MAG: hypothetical protein AAFP90_16755, partial [Planctomycetota bacterium]